MIETLAPSGDLDELVLDELQAKLDLIGSDSALVLDFSAVTFCGSSCIRLLIQTANRLREGGGSLVIRKPRAVVRRAFTVGAVDFLLEPEGGDGDTAPDT
jgi:anti-anti-sigma factor